MEVEQIELLHLMQLISPVLPIGAYSYSEGLESLVDQLKLSSANELKHWLSQELNYGTIRLEAAVMLRAYHCLEVNDSSGFLEWNAWLSAMRETEELRQQSWQMGRSLLNLFQNMKACPAAISPETKNLFSKISTFSIATTWTDHSIGACNVGECKSNEYNFAIAYALVAYEWKIARSIALLGYLQTWVTNLISASVRLIPLGQTQGQIVLQQLHPEIIQATDHILDLSDYDLLSCNLGMTLASMSHETQYSRLFRS